MTEYSYTSGGWSRSTPVQVAGSTPLPDVFLPYEMWTKMQAYARAAAPLEVNGFGLTTRIEGKRGEVTYVVRDIFILDQEVSGGHADIDPAALHKYFFDLVAAGGDTNEVNFQWHSHVNMGVSPSGTDTATIDRWTGEMLISCITNLKGETYTRLDWFYPQLRIGIERKLIIGDPPIDEPSEAIKKEVAEKVRKRPVGPYRPVAKKVASRVQKTARKATGRTAKAAPKLKPPSSPDDDDDWDTPDPLEMDSSARQLDAGPKFSPPRNHGGQSLLP